MLLKITLMRRTLPAKDRVLVSRDLILEMIWSTRGEQSEWDSLVDRRGRPRYLTGKAPTSNPKTDLMLMEEVGSTEDINILILVLLTTSPVLLEKVVKVLAKDLAYCTFPFMNTNRSFAKKRCVTTGSLHLGWRDRNPSCTCLSIRELKTSITSRKR